MTRAARPLSPACPGPYVRLGFDPAMPRFIARIFTNGVTAAACAIFEISLLT
jgi:hypothetical protein